MLQSVKQVVQNTISPGEPKPDSYQWNTVLVTGGGNGLGRAFAEHFLAKGKKVIIAGRTPSNLQQTASEVSNPRLHVMELDVGDVGSLATFVSRLLEEHDDLDCLVNNAGIMEPLDLHSPGLDVDAALAKADSEVDVNVRGVVHLTVRLLPQIRKRRGTIMNVSSLLGFTPMVETPIYSATKAFVHNWTWSLRTQLAQEGVRVIGIYPQMIESDLHRHHAEPNNNKKANNASAMSVAEFMADVVAGWDAGDDEVAAGMAKAPVAAYRAAFTQGTKTINSSASGVM